MEVDAAIPYDKYLIPVSSIRLSSNNSLCTSNFFPEIGGFNKLLKA